MTYFGVKAFRVTCTIVCHYRQVDLQSFYFASAIDSSHWYTLITISLKVFLDRIQILKYDFFVFFRIDSLYSVSIQQQISQF